MFNRARALLRSALHSMTLEPVMFVDGACTQAMIILVENVQLIKMCHFTQQLPDQVCQNLSAYEAENVAVQRGLSLFTFYNNVILSVVAVFFVLFMGAWSDIYGRKFPLVLSSGYQILNSAGYLLVHSHPSLPLESLYLVSFLASLLGGNRGHISFAFSYISDISNDRNRTSRISTLNSLWYLGGPVGTVLVAVLVKYSTYTLALSLVLLTYILATIYVVIFIPESCGPFAKKGNFNPSSETKTAELFCSHQKLVPDHGYNDSDSSEDLKTTSPSPTKTVEMCCSYQKLVPDHGYNDSDSSEDLKTTSASSTKTVEMCCSYQKLVPDHNYSDLDNSEVLKSEVRLSKMMSDFWNWDRVVESFYTMFRKRKGWDRAILLTVTATDMARVAARGFFLYLFTRKVLLWDASDYGYWTTFRTLVTALSSLVLVPMVSKMLHDNDSALILIGSLSSALEFACYALVLSPRFEPMLWVAPFLGMFTHAQVGLWSLPTKIVDPDEKGRISAAKGALTGFMPMVGYACYAAIYYRSVIFYPGAQFLLAVAINLIIFAIFTAFYVMAVTSQKDVPPGYQPPDDAQTLLLDDE